MQDSEINIKFASKKGLIMWFFPISPGTWAMIGIALIIFLIWTGIKSAGNKLTDSMDNAAADMNWKEFKRQVGPMTWGERIFTTAFFAIFVAFVIWLANIT